MSRREREGLINGETGRSVATATSGISARRQALVLIGTGLIALSATATLLFAIKGALDTFGDQECLGQIATLFTRNVSNMTEFFLAAGGDTIADATQCFKDMQECTDVCSDKTALLSSLFSEIGNYSAEAVRILQGTANQACDCMPSRDSFGF
jgi:hypothetical protein